MQEEVERLPQRPPAERVYERDRQRREPHPDQPPRAVSARGLVSESSAGPANAAGLWRRPASPTGLLRRRRAARPAAPSPEPRIEHVEPEQRETQEVRV